MDSFNRRDFLKLAGLLPLSLGAPQLRSLYSPGRKNVLVILFDAFSAENLSLYGYGRQTTPNIDRLARRAIRYHSHYAASSFTTPGTASLLTGTYPWTHRANQLEQKIDEHFVSRNLFSAFKDYYRIAYTHNTWANIFLEQFHADLEEWVPLESLFLPSSDSLMRRVFRKDQDIATLSWTRNMDIATEGYSYSLFLSRLYSQLRKGTFGDLEKRFPRGLPRHGGIGTEFLLEDAIDWTAARLPRLPRPFLGYFHFLPPHDPYAAPVQFYDRFVGDGLELPIKPQDRFTKHISRRDEYTERQKYDEFILYVDEQFNRLFAALESAGLLQDTWIVLTSDHGEMFERGITGHGIGALFEPVVRVPLMIFEPGRTNGQDVLEPTSAVDLLPTLLHLAGQPAVDWSEGRLMPPFTQSAPEPGRSLYALQAHKARPKAALKEADTLLLQDGYKLLYDFGFEGRGTGEFVRLYDIKADPQELEDLASVKPEIAAELLNQMKRKIAEVNAPYL